MVHGLWLRINGSRLMVNGEGLIITLERSSIQDLVDYSGSFFFLPPSDWGHFFIIIDGEW